MTFLVLIAKPMTTKERPLEAHRIKYISPLGIEPCEGMC